MTIDLIELITPYLFVFARFSAAFLMAPGLSDTTIPSRYRLLFCLSLSFVLRPLIEPLPVTEHHPTLILIVGYEVGVGLLIGFCMRFFLSMLSTMGSIVSVQIGLGNAMVFNPSLGAQATVIEQFFMVSGVILFFMHDMHHTLIQTCLKSYDVLPLYTATAHNRSFPLEIVQQLPMLMSHSFNMACQIALPFLILGLIFQFLLGLLSRVVPSFQVFFIALPLQILLGFFLLAYVIVLMLNISLDYTPTLLKPFQGV